MRAQVIFNRQLEEAEQDNLLVGTAVHLTRVGGVFGSGVARQTTHGQVSSRLYRSRLLH